jgi:uncharacterized protein (DUF2236 family)
LSRLVTVGFLPDRLRHEYGFAWDRRRARAFRAVTSVIRRTRWALPPMLREWRAARAA